MLCCLVHDCGYGACIINRCCWSNIFYFYFLSTKFSFLFLVAQAMVCSALDIWFCCLRFGTMVACFRYAPIDVYSVFLPPPKLEFSHDNHEWIQKEGDEVQLD